jgi:hypothetical protein
VNCKTLIGNTAMKIDAYQFMQRPVKFSFSNKNTMNISPNIFRAKTVLDSYIFWMPHFRARWSIEYFDPFGKHTKLVLGQGLQQLGICIKTVEAWGGVPCHKKMER